MNNTTAIRFISLLCFLALACAVAPAQAGEEPASKKQDKQPTAKAEPKKGRSLFDGKSLKGWKVVKKNDFENHGEVVVKEGKIILHKGQPATGVVLDAKPPRDNYEISLEAARLDGDDFFCGLTFPVGDDHLSLILGGWGGGVTGVSNLDGFSAVENETTGYTKFKKNKWYKLRLRVADDHVHAWLDGEEIVAVKTKGRKLSIWWEQEPMRPLGVATWNTTGAIRNIRLTDLAKKPSE